jgi:hypothetical protein
MKKLLLLSVILLSISCDGIDSKDDSLEAILKLEIIHIKRYNQLLELSKSNKDTAVSNYITKVKDTLKDDALTVKGLVNGNSGIMFGKLSNSKNKIEKYIKLCE